VSQDKYIGMDVHQATTSVATVDGGGKLIMECIPETKAPRFWSSCKECVALWRRPSRKGRALPGYMIF
jgi:hypothetical protein